ncbi:MAG: glycogen debranching protein GlgX [Thermoguttaceae bacterium]|nr:glycogen debranching protein GlgX [Thermoguttaceae bacterium]
MQFQERQKSGYHIPFGATLYEDGTLFSFTSRSATGARLLLYDDPNDREPSLVLNFDETRDRIGDVWRMFVPGAKAGSLYHFQLDGPYDPVNGNRFDGRARLIDPYAKALAGDFLPKKDGVCFPPKCVVVNEEFDWGDEPRIHRKLADEVIYELHVRGFTNSPTSGVSKPGTYLGVIEKIPYLKSLGITAVELMPTHEFPRNNTDGSVPKHANYWGYDPIAFFAPHRGYAWSPEPGAQVHEFKEMVRALHCAGIEVYLDVVFNHTAEGNERGETFSFKGLENRNSYLLSNDGKYVNFTGCGNTINGNHPWMRDLIISCLRSWIGNYHIDGFRFDLASILSRDRNGNLVWNPPVLERISEDPLLSYAKIIAEAWDAAGAYQVGSFGARRWAEWNGRYRDDVRRFWRGDDWSLGAFATRLSGSSDLYRKLGRSPSCSVNFITAHDGFTLNDLVTYNHKHNYANGEENRDGDNNNLSFNFGVEGETRDERVNLLRARQTRNFFCTLLLSQGTPMIVAGDEGRRTQKGNNNAYCQDTAISWLDWDRTRLNEDLRRFVSALIRFRRQEASLRRRDFLTGKPQVPGELPDVSWFDRNGGTVDWNAAKESTLTCLLSALDPFKDPGFAAEIAQAGVDVSNVSPFDVMEEAAPEARFHILVMFNATNEPQTFYFPSVAKLEQFAWRIFVDTAAKPPCDVYPNYDGPAPDALNALCLPERSMRVYLAERRSRRGH